MSADCQNLPGDLPCPGALGPCMRDVPVPPCQEPHQAEGGIRAHPSGQGAQAAPLHFPVHVLREQSSSLLIFFFFLFFLAII